MNAIKSVANNAGIKLCEKRNDDSDLEYVLTSTRTDEIHPWGQGELWAMQTENGCIVHAGECETDAVQAIVFQSFEGAAEGCIEHFWHWNMSCTPVRLK